MYVFNDLEYSVQTGGCSVVMSVDILPAKVAQGHSFKYPHMPNMKEVAPMKRRDSKGVNISNFDPNCIIYNPNTDTTYLRGKLLGKVNRTCIQ